VWVHWGGRERGALIEREIVLLRGEESLTEGEIARCALWLFTYMVSVVKG